MAWQSSTINPATTTPAADISKIANDLQQLRGVIGGTPDAQIPSVWATPANVLAQTANSATTAGTSTAYTLAPATAIASYAAGQTFWVTFHTASGANPTLQISGVASPPTLVRQAADGTYVNIGVGDIPGNHRSRVTLLSASQAWIEELPPRSSSGLKNKIINGKMDFAQRGTSFVSPANGAYTLDRFYWGNLSSAAATISQQSDVPSSNEFQNSLRVAITTADTSIAAGDFAGMLQSIEGFNVRDLIGRTFTLSFWVRSSKTGTHCISLLNDGPNRTYVAEYTINAANTWEFKTITVSGGLITAGTWNWTTGRGLIVAWALAAGTTYQTTAGAWQTGAFYATANQVNCLDSNTNIFAITGVQLELGSTATPFEHRLIGAELALCQRYYWRLSGSTSRFIAIGNCESTTRCQPLIKTPVTMRALPSCSSSTITNFFIRGAASSVSVSTSTSGWGGNTEDTISNELNTATAHGGVAGGAANLVTPASAWFIDASAEL
jgi:hypothetical protein